MPKKKRWTCEVVEVRYQTCTYIVEARTESEARRKADRGHTLHETTDGQYSVNARFVQPAITLETGQ